MDLVWVGVGGGLGAVARYLVGVWIIPRVSSGFPFHTLLVNVSGSFAIGALLVLLMDQMAADPAWRLFLIVGVLGGYTTFSSFSYEALALLEAGKWTTAAVYVAGSNALSLVAAYLGMVLVRTLGR